MDGQTIWDRNRLPELVKKRLAILDFGQERLKDARYTAAQPTSSGTPNLLIGVRLSTFCLRSGSPAIALREIAVSMKPGAMALTRIPFGDRSTARDRTMPRYADFAVLWPKTFGRPKKEVIDAVNSTLP